MTVLMLSILTARVKALLADKSVLANIEKECAGFSEERKNDFIFRVAVATLICDREKPKRF